MSLPDRSHIATEQRNAASMSLHALDIDQCVELINREDAMVSRAVAHARQSIVAFLNTLVPRFAAGGRLIYLGAGTSGRLGVLDAAEAPPTFQLEHGRIVGIIAGGDRSLRYSSESLEDDPQGASQALQALHLTDNDTLLGLAAGGTTPYVHGAFSIAKTLAPGCVCGFLTCSQIDKPADVDHLIVIQTGPEVLTGSTRMKAGSATKMVLNMISTTLMVQTGRVYENLMVDLKASNDKLRDRSVRIIMELTHCDRADAIALLDKAGGRVKVAVLMARQQCDYATAMQRLSACNNDLGKALTIF